MNLPSRPSGFHLLDVIALMVGYGLASMLIRAYWPDSGTISVWEICAVCGVFAWLGFAMAGPIVLMIRRPPDRTSFDDERPGQRTWSEMAWLIVGFYWVGLTILVVPARIRGARILDSAILGVFPVIAAIGLRFFSSRTARGQSGELTWTHRAGIWLLLTWPFAWVAMIVLGKNLL